MTTWSIDPTQTSSGNRVQTGAELNGLLSAGDTVQWKKDYHHDGNGTNGFIQSFLELDNLTLTSYGSGAKPALDARIWLPPGSGGWTTVRTSSGVRAYRKLIMATASDPVRRVWIGARNDGIQIGQRTAGTSIGRPPGANGSSGLSYEILSSFTLADQDTPDGVLDRLYAAYAAQGRLWCSLDGASSADKVLYMLVPSTGASDTPDNWYAGLAVLQQGTGTTIGAASPRGLRFRNCADVITDGLDVGGAVAAIQLAANTTKATSNWTVQNCDLTYWWTRGVQVLGSGSFGNSTIIIQDNVLDAKPTASEQDLLTGAGWFHSAESIECLSSSDTEPLTGLRVRRNYLDGLQHNAINVATRSDTGGGAAGSVSDIQIEFNEVSAQNFESDVRGMAVHGISGTGNIIRGNRFTNLCCESEFSGNITVSGNWVLGSRLSISQPTLSTCIRLGPNGARNTPTTALVFEHNVLLGCAEMPIRILCGQENLPSGAIKVNRNIMQMGATAETRVMSVRNNFAGAAPPGPYNFQSGAVAITYNHVERATEPVIEWRTTGTGANTQNPFTTGPSGGVDANFITYSGNTWGTRLSSIPPDVYPPVAGVAIFG